MLRFARMFALKNVALTTFALAAYAEFGPSNAKAQDYFRDYQVDGHTYQVDKMPGKALGKMGQVIDRANDRQLGIFVIPPGSGEVVVLSAQGVTDSAIVENIGRQVLKALNPNAATAGSQTQAAANPQPPVQDPNVEQRLEQLAAAVQALADANKLARTANSGQGTDSPTGEFKVEFTKAGDAVIKVVVTDSKGRPISFNPNATMFELDDDLGDHYRLSYNSIGRAKQAGNTAIGLLKGAVGGGGGVESGKEFFRIELRKRDKPDQYKDMGITGEHAGGVGGFAAMGQRSLNELKVARANLAEIAAEEQAKAQAVVFQPDPDAVKVLRKVGSQFPPAALRF